MEEHELTHCPYRSWCPICVESQGKEDPHYRATIEDIHNEAPTISMDYKELSEHAEAKSQLTIVICRDNWTQDVAAMVVKAKGSIECSKRFVEYLDTFGYNEIVLKSDNEIAIKVLRDDIINNRVRSPRLAGSVPMHPQTHGRVERAVQEVIDQIKKVKLVLEKKLRSAISVDLPIINWMVEHAALLINRHFKGHDGKTAYKRKHQREAFPTQFEFGEQVLARFAPKRSKTKRKLPLAPRSTPATWVGINEATAGNIVILQSGRAARVRTVFRRTLEDQWNLERILTAKAIPSNPNPANLGEGIIVLKPHEDIEGNFRQAPS